MRYFYKDMNKGIDYARNGRFASGKGGGNGLYYSMGKGKGAVVGESSSIIPTGVTMAKEKIINMLQKAGYGDVAGNSPSPTAIHYQLN